MTPPVWPIGSTMIAATVSGSSIWTTLSTIVAHVVPQSAQLLPNGQR